MSLYKPEPGTKFTLRDLGVLDAPCDVFDSLTGMGERLHPGSGCQIFLRDSEDRRVIRKSSGPVAEANLLRAKYILQGSLTDRVCDESHPVTHHDVMSWSPSMPEISDFGAKCFVAHPLEGPAGDKVGIVTIMRQTGDLELPQALEDASHIAALAAQRILLKASLATLQRIARGQDFIAVPPRSKH